jgi:glycosyltransferase involved in cell wall biosynthesis
MLGGLKKLFSDKSNSSLPLITILMPCRDMKETFLHASIKSVLGQSTPAWRLSIIIDPDTPQATRKIIEAYLSDKRISLHINKGKYLGGALNTGMNETQTPFVSILLSDDMYDPQAVEVLNSYIKSQPKIDFFHSARRHIDQDGRFRGDIMPSREDFTIDFFKKYGSPVKHILCWKRSKGIEVGGMDEELSHHGVDDYDFPWKMAEGGAKFKAIKDCLYYYRVHHDFYRLTTHVTVARQLEIQRERFKKHKVSPEETKAFLKNALWGYIIADKAINFCEETFIISSSNFREITNDRKSAFLAHGFAERHFFPHRIYILPKGGPDGLRLAKKMCSVSDPAALREIVLYATSPAIDEFPPELFFDKELVWHEQQFGRFGQIATANLVRTPKDIYVTTYVSDIVQRLSRRKDFATRLEKKFRGWYHMLLNAVMAYAAENKIENVFSATGKHALANTDPARSPKDALYKRVYDDSILQRYDALNDGEWWFIRTSENIKKIVMPARERDYIEHGRTICITHDIERGLGHTGIDEELARKANGNSPRALSEMLKIEKQLNVKATYNVVGSFLKEVREEIEEGSHAIAFHSFDHRMDEEQLWQCRSVDYRIKGYRAPQSKTTESLSDENLSHHNFEWFASSVSSLGAKYPKMKNGIVKIPISFDDFSLYNEKMSFEKWEQLLFKQIRENDFLAFGLHDCYAEHWLAHYEKFLNKIKTLGNLKTLDEVAFEVILSNGE